MTIGNHGKLQGLEVLVSKDFRTKTDEKGDILIFPEGDIKAPPSGRMPKDGYFFDSIVRQEAFDEDKLNPEDNLEEFGPIAEADLEHIRRSVAELEGSQRAMTASVSRTANGAAARVPLYTPEKSPPRPVVAFKLRVWTMTQELKLLL